jgi:DNA-binding helix-hairpin-helix protein with protein kinase domain
MELATGQQVQAELLKHDLTVQARLGEGGQGAVYLVDGPSGPQALKWYAPAQATDEQREALRYLVRIGPPRGSAGRRFIWPLDLVTSPTAPTFGYLMPLIDMKRFAEVGEVWARLKPAPGFPALCEISYQIAHSYGVLHLSGHCYRDIARGNVLFDPRTGDALICDNDNVGVNRQSRSQVLGTMDYMAPELIRGEADPSTETDLHSLAVLLFNLWAWHHPMQGEMEYRYHSWDPAAKKRVYGLDPVFIFDPGDTRNRLPNDPDYTTAQTRWDLCPRALQKLFTHAFTVGLKQPGHRVTEGQWQDLFLQLKDGVLPCPSCKAENLWEPGQATLSCWHCRQQVAVPPKLVFTHPGGKKHYLLLTREAQVLRRHVNPLADEEGSTVLGQMAQNPANPQVWGIRNLTSSPWRAVFADGTSREIAPQKAVPLSAGLKLNIAGTNAEIVP